jgi:hypothetical protein
LEAELARLELEKDQAPDTEDMVRRGGMVHFDEEIEPRFMGASSGIAMSRLVLEEAKLNIGSRNVRELFPAEAGRRQQSVDAEAEGGQVKAYPSMSSVSADRLPVRATTDGLVGVFCQKCELVAMDLRILSTVLLTTAASPAQFLLPTLHEPTFLDEIDAVYAGSDDPYQNFVLRMVLAISLQKISTTYLGLADSFYLAAFKYLPAALRPMDLKTLQCLVLIGQYSLLTPTRTAVYYVIGLATKLTQQLGLHQEETIELSGVERELNPLEKDMRRRLFWIV